MLSRLALPILFFILILLSLLFEEITSIAQASKPLFTFSDNNYDNAKDKFDIEISPIDINNYTNEIVYQITFVPSPSLLQKDGSLNTNIAIESNAFNNNKIYLKRNDYYNAATKMTFPVSGSQIMYPADRYHSNLEFQVISNNQPIPAKITINSFGKLSYYRVSSITNSIDANNVNKVKLVIMRSGILICISIFTAILIWTLNVYTLLNIYLLIKQKSSVTAFVIAAIAVNLLAIYQIRTSLPDMPQSSLCLYDYCVNLWTLIGSLLASSAVLYSWHNRAPTTIKALDNKVPPTVSVHNISAPASAMTEKIKDKKKIGN